MDFHGSAWLAGITKQHAVVIVVKLRGGSQEINTTSGHTAIIVYIGPLG